MARVTDEMIRRWLVWCRNFEEIEDYKFGPGAGRRIRVQVPAGITRDGQPLRGGLLGHREEDVVPSEMVFTPREAMAFAYGCAVGGAARARGDWTQEDWERQAAAKRNANA